MKLKQIARLAFFDVSRALGTIRWVAVPIVLFLVGTVGLDDATYDYAAQEPRDANFWDVPLSMMASAPLVVFVFVLGFVFVTGDLYVRDRDSGTAAMTLIRATSRASWWTAKLASLGVLSFVYSFVAFFSILALSAIHLPIELAPSPAAEIPWGDESSLYPRLEELPMPLLFLLVILYTAFALWGLGAVVLGASLLYPRMVTPLGVGLSWVLFSWLVAPIYNRQWPGTLDPMYHVTYVIHFESPYFEPTPWSTSFIVIAATLASTLLLGAWRLRKTDI